MLVLNVVCINPLTPFSAKLIEFHDCRGQLVWRVSLANPSSIIISSIEEPSASVKMVSSSSCFDFLLGLTKFNFIEGGREICSFKKRIQKRSEMAFENASYVLTWTSQSDGESCAVCGSKLFLSNRAGVGGLVGRIEVNELEMVKPLVIALVFEHWWRLITR